MKEKIYKKINNEIWVITVGDPPGEQKEEINPAGLKAYQLLKAEYLSKETKQNENTSSKN